MPTPGSLRALVLARDHRCLLVADGERWSAPALDARTDARPLRELTAYARERLGLELPQPIGSRGARARELAFVLDAPRGAAAPGTRWAPLAQAARDAWIWSAYVELLLGGWEPPTRELDVFAFGAGAEEATRLAHLVCCGAKRGTALWLRAAEHEGAIVPYAGLHSIVTDGFGLPRCVIRSEEVRELRFGDASAELAALEAEGDRTLEAWREVHQAYFAREAAALGLQFGDDERIAFERFRVLHVIGRSDA